MDIAEALDRIFDYTASHSLESFAADRITIDAVVFGVSVAIIWETISRELHPVRETIRRDLERS